MKKSSNPIAAIWPWLAFSLIFGGLLLRFVVDAPRFYFNISVIVGAVLMWLFSRSYPDEAEKWTRLGRMVGNFIAHFVLTIFYFTVFVPFGLLVSLAQDQLDIKEKGKVTTWQERTTKDLTTDDARKLA